MPESNFSSASVGSVVTHGYAPPVGLSRRSKCAWLATGNNLAYCVKSRVGLLEIPWVVRPGML